MSIYWRAHLSRRKVPHTTTSPFLMATSAAVFKDLHKEAVDYFEKTTGKKVDAILADLVVPSTESLGNLKSYVEAGQEAFHVERNKYRNMRETTKDICTALHRICNVIVAGSGPELMFVKPIVAASAWLLKAPDDISRHHARLQELFRITIVRMYAQ